MHATFNLVDEPWIPVTTIDGENTTLGLRDTIRRAGSIRAAGRDGMERVAILRLLAAVHHRALDAAGADETHARRLYRDGVLDAGAADAYLDRWHRAFDLRDPERPFMQTAGLALPDRPVGAIDIEDGDLFRMDLRERIGAADATVRLLKHLAYDAAGIKPAAPGDRRASKGKLYPTPMPGTGRPGTYVAVWAEAGNLARTVLLADPYDGEHGAAWWETGVPPYELVGRTPSGTTDAYTTPTRRVLLVWDGDEAVAARTTYGVTPDDRDPALDPMHAPTAAAGRSLPREQLDCDGLWQCLDRIANRNGRPRTLAWASHVCPPDENLTIHATGATYRNLSKITGFDDMTLDTPAGALDDPDLYAMTETVDRMCRLCGTIMADMVRLLGRDPGDRFLAEDRRRYTDELRRWADPAVRRGAADGRYDRAVHDAYTLLNRRLNEWNDRLARDLMRGASPRTRNDKDHPQWTRIMFGTLRRTLDDWNGRHDRPDPDARKANPAAADGPVRPTAAGKSRAGRGRKGMAVTRTGGGLPDRTFPTQRAAVEWLRVEGGRPKAQSGPIGRATRTGGAAYGYGWRNAEGGAA